MKSGFVIGIMRGGCGLCSTSAAHPRGEVLVQTMVLNAGRRVSMYRTSAAKVDKAADSLATCKNHFVRVVCKQEGGDNQSGCLSVVEERGDSI